MIAQVGLLSRREATSCTIRPTTEADLSAVQAIYAHHVATGTASFELEPPDLDEIRRRWSALVSGGYPHLVAADGAKVLATPMRAPIGRARPTATPSRTRSMSTPPRMAAASAGRSSRA
jgi:L-amino acid N-acyltransferase YncA